MEDKYNNTEDISKLDGEIDNAIKSKMANATTEVLKLCLPDGLVRKFPKNNILAMVQTGAKGSLVNV